MSSSSKFSFSSTFNWEDANLRALLHTIPFFVEQENDKNGTPGASQNPSATTPTKT